MEAENFDLKPKLLAFSYVILMFGMIFLYVKEFPFLGNTLGIKKLVGFAFLAAAILAGLGFLIFRKRLSPISNHGPELVFTIFPILFFAPLVASKINRIGQTIENQEFAFVSETSFFASGYGILKGEEIKPTGFRLTIREKNGDLKTFKYKTQAYFPITKSGETILLPVRKGVFGFGIMDLH